MAYTAHALTHDNAHGGIEYVLAALFAALTTGLAALILNTFGNCRGNASGTLLSHCRSHG
ncbi:hypothetical protein D3C77_649040 [compost metagenome]